MGAVGEAAEAGGIAHLAEGLGQGLRFDCPQTKLVDSRAIDEETVADPVEPPGRRRLAAQAVAGDLADRRLAAERAKDRALSNPGVPDEQRAMTPNKRAQLIHVLARLRVHDDCGIFETAVDLGELGNTARRAEIDSTSAKASNWSSVTRRGGGLASAATTTIKSTLAAIVLVRPPALRRSRVKLRGSMRSTRA